MSTLLAPILAISITTTPVSCQLQEGAEWSDTGAAVICNGIPGFFVSSERYRALRDTTTHPAYRLISQELALSRQENAELRAAIQAGDRTIEGLKDALTITSSAARQLLTSYNAMADAAREARAAANMSIWERLGWVLLGAGAVIGAGYAIKEAR